MLRACFTVFLRAVESEWGGVEGLEEEAAAGAEPAVSLLGAWLWWTRDRPAIDARRRAVADLLSREPRRSGIEKDPQTGLAVYVIHPRRPEAEALAREHGELTRERARRDREHLAAVVAARDSF